MKRLLLIGSVLATLISCDSSQIETLDSPLILGKATPINLDLEVTTIQVEDYVSDPSRLDSISTDGPFNIIAKDGALILRGRPKQPLYNLTFWSHGIGESVLLKRTKKTMYSFMYQPVATESDIKIKGEFNAWNPNNTVLQKNGNGFSGYELLSPGTYQYLFVIDGKEMRDPNNPDSVSNGMGGWNSVIQIEGSDPGRIPFLKTNDYSSSRINLKSNNTVQKAYAYWGNTLLPATSVSIRDRIVSIKLPENAKTIQRSAIRLWAYNEEGVSNDVLIPLNNGKVISSIEALNRSDYESMVMYFLMVDRFNNGNSTNDRPLNIPEVHPKADYFGGDLSGVTAKIN